MKNIINRLVKITFSTYLFVFISACSLLSTKSTDTKNSTTTNINLPKWVLDPELSDGLAAVGISSEVDKGFNFQIKKAENDARISIISRMELEISSILDSCINDAKVKIVSETKYSDKNKINTETSSVDKANGIEEIQKLFYQVTKSIIANMNPSNIRRVNIYRNEDSTVYIHMLLRYEDLIKYLKKSINMYEEGIKTSKLSRKNKEEARNISKKFLDELDRRQNL